MDKQAPLIILALILTPISTALYIASDYSFLLWTTLMLVISIGIAKTIEEIYSQLIYKS